jgi:hypothetical protein
MVYKGEQMGRLDIWLTVAAGKEFRPGFWLILPFGKPRPSKMASKPELRNQE